MIEAEEAVEDETEDGEAMTLSDATGDLDQARLAKGLLTTLMAYETVNFEESAAANGIDREQFSTLAPTAMASSLVESMISTLMGANSVSAFTLLALNLMSELAGAVRVATSYASPDSLAQLIDSLHDYAVAPSGSAKEVLADRRIATLLDSINEDTLRQNPSFVAAFADSELGFIEAADRALSEACSPDDEEDEDEEDDSETPTKPYLHG